jgi:NAD(P)-dependent dehydrogenase (short-subunit alcohol dehydrogenase family)
MALFKLSDPRAEDEGTIPASFGTCGRTGHEVEAAGAILYLASIAAGYSNGITLMADGGSTVVMPSTYG